MKSKSVQTIILGGGCFWCLDAAYKLIKGVIKVEQGYSGGNIDIVDHYQVATGNTGQAEVVRVSFDPRIIKLTDLLDVFWTIHDPTTPNRQGYDIGPQYRSIILYQGSDQLKIIEASLKKAKEVWGSQIVTEIKPFKQFYPASKYQTDYELNRPDYCQLIINPKLIKLRTKFAALIR
jgi:peptide-methionine (S)-S-oxide reductase